MKIRGKFIKKIFRSEDSGFTVGIFQVEESDEFDKEETIFTGYFPEITVDQNYLLEGEVVEHQRYGEQFSVRVYEKEKPSTENKVIEYLASDLFKGIGKQTATKIVDRFGINATDKIIKNKDILKEVNLSQKKINDLYEALSKYEESHDIVIRLSEFGFDTKEATKIYNVYGKNAILHVESNPYIILDDINDISFIKIDKLRHNLNIDDYDSSRIEAAIIYYLNYYFFYSGDTYTDLETVKYEVNRNLSIEIPNIEQHIERLMLDMKLVVEGDKIYLFEYFEAEENIKDYLSYAIKEEEI